MLPAELLAPWLYEEDRSAELHAQDRSAIYGGFHLYRHDRLMATAVRSAATSGSAWTGCTGRSGTSTTLPARYYLLGRDRLIAELGAQPGQSDARHRLRHRPQSRADRPALPAARLFGLDAAQPMLEIAARKLERAAVRATTGPRRGRGARSRRRCSAHAGGFDHITISYCLSMVDDPERAVRAAVRHLAPGGTLHIVDFGDMAGLPGWFRGAMAAWLAKFHVRYRPEVAATLACVGEHRRRPT